MKIRTLFAILMCAFAMLVSAQKITPVKFALLSTDLLARKDPVTTQDGKACCAIRVDVVGVKNLVFPEAAVATKYSQNEYIVYIPEGAKSLTYMRGNETSTITFGDYGPEEVEGKCTYRLLLDTDNKMRSALFYVHPTNAVVKINGSKVALDENGTGSMDLAMGKYNYSVSASGYNTEEGELTLSDDEIITIKDIALNEIKYEYKVKCNKPEASVFIDGVPYGTVADIADGIQLPNGKHQLRITLMGYDEHSENFTIDNGNDFSDVTLVEKKAIVVKHKDERTKSSISIRRHTDFLFSEATLFDDLRTHVLKYNIDFHQYAGLVAFKEGISFGAVYGSREFCEKIDDAAPLYAEMKKNEEATAKATTKENEKKQNRVGIVVDVPLQMGFAVPMSKYNTSHAAFVGGGYFTGYYIGHSSASSPTDKPIETYSYDFGLRADATFYIHKFAIGLEVSKSLSKLKLGAFIGIHAGWRIYKSKQQWGTTTE